MNKQKKTIKSNFFKKIFIKICRIFNYEIIDQSNLYLPVSKKSADKNLSEIGKESLVIPMGRIKIQRPVKSLDIILRSCASINMLSQSKNRIFQKSKAEYSLMTLKSLIKSINYNKNLFNKIKLKLTIIDYNSGDQILKEFKRVLKNEFFESEILNLDIDFYRKKIKAVNQQGKQVSQNQISNMSNIHQSLTLAKKCDDLIYLVEDDYIHKTEAIEEMIYAYEKISTQLGRELILCPTDYPYLYNNLKNTKVLLGNKYHWKVVGESLCSFLTSKKIINQYWNKFVSVSKFEHYPFEKPFHDIYKKELCLSPIPSLAVHFTNINSVYGLSPFINYKKLWDENKF